MQYKDWLKEWLDMLARQKMSEPQDCCDLFP